VQVVHRSKGARRKREEVSNPYAGVWWYTRKGRKPVIISIAERGKVRFAFSNRVSTLITILGNVAKGGKLERIEEPNEESSL
jgi:hypothetical protein